MAFSPADELCSAERKRQLELLLSSAELDRFLATDAVERMLALEGDDDHFPEHPCPFCDEVFAATSERCAHADDTEQFCEERSLACPLCSARARADLSHHVAAAHGALQKDARRRRGLPHGRPSLGATSGLLSSLAAKDLSSRSLPRVEAVVDRIVRTLRDAPPAVTAPGGGGKQPVVERPRQAAPLPPSPAASSTSSSTLLSAFQGSPAVGSSSSLSEALREEPEQQQEQSAMRAAFTRSLILSTIFGDS